MEVSRKRKLFLINSVMAIVSGAIRLVEEEELSSRSYVKRRERVVDWWATSWGRMLRAQDVADEESYNGQEFRLRFRLPHKLFQYLVTECKEHNVFGRSHNAAGEKAIPTEIKVLGALRTLGRATLFDDVAEMSGADESTHRKAFYECIKFIRTRFEAEWIKLPEGEELIKIMKEFELLGFPGCIGSMDATHIHWIRCPAGATNNHSGKEKRPTRAFNVTVAHHGMAFSVARGQPGARNDKCIVRFDPLMNKMRFQGLYSDIKFTLQNKEGISKEHKGAYLISDNGYHKWKQFTCPYKFSPDEHVSRWSRWVESTRKNVECFFGRLKMRFKCLLNPIWISNDNQIDDLFISCTILHNMLLTWDGKDIMYENPITWHAVNGIQLNDDEPETDIFDRIQRRILVHTDMSTMLSGSNEDIHDNNEVEDPTFESQRDALIEHFNYHWEKKEIIWLKEKRT
jgi:hypothetical protein